MGMSRKMGNLSFHKQMALERRLEALGYSEMLGFLHPYVRKPKALIIRGCPVPEVLRPFSFPEIRRCRRGARGRGHGQTHRSS